MIDIHNHIIFGVDDGSKSIEQSVRMIKAAQNAGITEICFTPHYMEDGYKTEKSILSQKVYELKEALQKENINVGLHLGEEIFIFPELAKNLDKVVCLNDSKYILIEFPLVEEINYIDDVLYELMTMDKIPIIAHPERYMASASDFSFVQKLCEKGALLQINMNSLIGHYGRTAQKLAIRILKENLASFVASDAHSSGGYFQYIDSKEVLKRFVGMEKFEILTQKNPELVLKNEDVIKINELPSRDLKKSFLDFFKKKVG